MDQAQYSRILSYLSTGKVPSNLTRTQRESLKAEGNVYTVEGEQLVYKKNNSKV